MVGGGNVLTSALLEVGSSSRLPHDLSILQLAVHWLLSRQQGQYLRGWIPNFPEPILKTIKEMKERVVSMPDSEVCI